MPCCTHQAGDCAGVKLRLAGACCQLIRLQFRTCCLHLCHPSNCSSLFSDPVPHQLMARQHPGARCCSRAVPSITCEELGDVVGHHDIQQGGLGGRQGAPQRRPHDGAAI